MTRIRNFQFPTASLDHLCMVLLARLARGSLRSQAYEEDEHTNPTTKQTILKLNSYSHLLRSVRRSGHTVNITLCAMTWFSYSHVVPILDWDPIFSRFGRLTNKLGDLERWTTVKLLCWIYATIGYICIVGSRFHYSLDVFIGLLLTVCFYKFHYDVIRIAHLRKTKIMKLLCWLEKDAEDLKWYRQYLSQVNDAVVYIGAEQENLRTSPHGELPSSTELAASVV